MINYKELKQAIRQMNYRQKLFKVLREELFALGYWKNKTRGKRDVNWFENKKDKIDSF